MQKLKIRDIKEEGSVSNEQNVRVSVIMVLTGTDEGLPRRLESVLGQLSTEDELIVVASEGTEAAAACAAVHSVDMKTAANGACFLENMEAALRKSSGKYIFLAESCDTWHPGKLAGCLEVLERGKMAIVHNAVVVDGDLNELKSSLLGHRMRQRHLLGLLRNHGIGCCMAFRSELLAAALPFPPWDSTPDRWLCAIASRMGGVAFIDRTLMFYCSQRTSTGRHRFFNVQRKGTDFRALFLVSFALNRRIRMIRSVQQHDRE